MQTSNHLKLTSIVVIVVMLAQFVAPVSVLALTSGPVQPEYTGFEPVATTNMVSPFTGSFTYNLPVINIPGANGGGYALSLSYHSGVQPEGEASWVGYGWSLNPGAIVRNKRGLPDDYLGDESSPSLRDEVVHYNHVKPNWTITAGLMLNLELASSDFDQEWLQDLTSATNVGGRYSIRLNSYKGFGYSAGFSINVAGLANYGYTHSDGTSYYQKNITPAGFLSKYVVKYINDGLFGKKDSYYDEIIATSKRSVVAGSLRRAGMAASSGLFQSADRLVNFYGLQEFAGTPRPQNSTGYENGMAFNISYGTQLMTVPFVGLQGQGSGSFNIQHSGEPEGKTSKAYGYLNLGKRTDFSGTVGDYFVEKDAPYTVRDKFLSLPFLSADNFSLTGEGLGGGFRFHHSKVGMLNSNENSSSTTIGNFAVEEGFSPMGAWSIGGDLGVGVQSLSTEKFDETFDANSSYRFATEPVQSQLEAVEEPVVARFNNDMGGSIVFDQSDDPVLISDTKIPNSLRSVANDGKRTGRSSHIEWYTNKELGTGTGGALGFVRTGQPNQSLQAWCRNGVGEFAITNAEGSRYIYGLPSYSEEERSLNYIHGKDIDIVPDQNGDLAKLSTGLQVPDERVYFTGEYASRPYASSYLLTEILNPDFIDFDQNGPDGGDLGAWVKFEYDRIHGTYGGKEPEYTGTWYKWRVPYNGLAYNAGDISAPDDNTGTVQSGLKQIFYLNKVETRSHYALFYTEDRTDGISASHDEAAASSNSDLSNPVQGSHTLKKLTKIELYSKALGQGDDALIRTVHFEYEGSASSQLSPGLPNSTGGGGRLTLKRVWFEHNGVQEVGITPYSFDYEYAQPDDYGADGSAIRLKYPEITEFAEELSAAEQNPSYNHANSDAWGNYSANGVQRKQNMRVGVEQDPDLKSFDPAAWHLKRIALPSGGEIHVQYEQHDYNYVQDRRAMSLVPIDDYSGESPAGHDNSAEGITKFYLDFEREFGSQISPEDLKGIRSQIETEYVQGGEELYFKFLYTLFDGDELPTIQGAEYDHGYLTGYSKVKEVDIENGRLYVVLADAPRDVCIDWVESAKLGAREAKLNKQIFESFGPGLGTIPAMMHFSSQFLNFSGLTSTAESCRRFNPTHSYIRVPLTIAKKGGGVRVKRLLMFDPGSLDNNAAERLYGSEYIYSKIEKIDEETSRVISSGVATNEPGSMREENALVRSLKKRFPQTTYQRATAGEDKDQFEGPLGESLLPAPSIGYSKVTIKNIHDGPNSAGFSVQEFHTAKEFPFDGYYKHLGEEAIKYEGRPIKAERATLPLVLFQDSRVGVEARQAYRFILNSMHGQVKSLTTFGGKFDDPLTHFPSSRQEFEYFEPGELVPMFYGLDRPFRYEQPGKEMEVAIEARKVRDNTRNGSLEGDVTFQYLPIIPPPAPAFTMGMTYSQDRMEFDQIVSTKVIRYPVIQKAVTQYKDGIASRSENVAFDPATGSPIISKTTDAYDGLELSAGGHNGTYHTYNLRAWSEYPEMGPKLGRYHNTLLLEETGTANPALLTGKMQNTVHIDVNTGITSTTRALKLSNGSAELRAEGQSKFREGYLIELTYLNDITEELLVSEVIGPSGGIITIDLEDTDNTIPAAGTTDVKKIRILNVDRVNNLTANYATFTTYGEDKSSSLAWSAELYRRQSIADILNNQLPHGKDMTLEHWQMPPGGIRIDKELFHEDSIGINDSRWEGEYGILFDIDENDPTKMTVDSRRQVCGWQDDPHPAVDHLNAILNNSWGRAAASDVMGTQTSNVCGTVVHEINADLTNSSVQSLQNDIQANWADDLKNHLTGICVKGTPSGTKQLEDLEIEFSNSLGPAPFDDDQAVFHELTSYSDIQVLSSMALRYGSANTPLLRMYAHSGSGTAQNCLLEWGFIPDTDGNLAALSANVGGMAGFQGTTTATYQQLFDVNQSSNSFVSDNVGRFEMLNSGQLAFRLLLENDLGESNVLHRYNLSFTKYLNETTLADNHSGMTQTITRRSTGPGHFEIDDDGQLVYYSHGDSAPINISALEFVNDEVEFPSALRNAGPASYAGTVVAASAMTYSDDWGNFMETHSGIFYSDNVFDTGQRGRWRPHETWVYRAPTINVNMAGDVHTSGTRTWNTGMYDNFHPFEPPNSSVNIANGWLKLNTVMDYSSNGEALEEVNILGIPSAAQFGYDEMLPVLLAQNARNADCHFNSFEDHGFVTSNFGLKPGTAHAGNWSWNLSDLPYTVYSYPIDQRLNERGFLVRFWALDSEYESLDGLAAGELVITGGSTISLTNLSEIARTGEWALYETRLEPGTALGVTLPTTANIKVDIPGNRTVLMDDIRVQPLDAEMSTWVYDPFNYQVVAVFDDQHFGSFYQYNGKGQLIRQVRETERGLMTISESHYHTPKQDRGAGFAGMLIDQGQPLLDPSLQAHPGLGTKNWKQQPQRGQRSGGSDFDFNRTFSLPDSLIPFNVQEIEGADDSQTDSLKSRKGL